MNGPLEAILDANPTSSTNEIAEAIADYVEECVIDTVRLLPPPHIPSPVQARLRGMMTKRRGKTIRGLGAGSSNRESFLVELYHIRRELNGHLEDGTVPIPMITPSDLGGIYSNFNNPAIDDSLDGQVDSEDSAPIRRLDRPLPTFQPYSHAFQTAIVERLGIRKFEPTISNLVASDRVFEMVAKSVESEVRSFASQKNLPIGFDFLLGRDPEYPKWKRYVLRLDVDLDFDSKMSLWTEADSRVRERLRILGQLKPELSEKIKEISSNLFIHMDL